MPTDLLDPCLLPSLVIAFIWLIHNIWESSDAVEVTNSVHLLQTFTKSPTSPEVRAIHKTILAIVADPLSQTLESLSGPKASGLNVESLLATLQPSRQFRCANTATKIEIEIWTSTPQGIIGSIRHTFQSLLQWTTSLDLNAGLPTSFTYKQIDTAVQLCGATDVVHALLQEVKPLSRTANYESAIDLVSSLICARGATLPETGSSLTLREALKLEYDNLATLLEKGDTIHAETMLRVYRRVEALSVIPPQPELSLDATSGPIVPELTNLDLQSINIGANAANSDIDVAALQNAAPADPEDIDKMLDAAVAAPMMDETDYGAGALGDVGESMEDIFAGLTDNGDMGMGDFEDLDMEGMF